MKFFLQLAACLKNLAQETCGIRRFCYIKVLFNLPYYYWASGRHSGQNVSVLDSAGYKEV